MPTVYSIHCMVGCILPLISCRPLPPVPLLPALGGARFSVKPLLAGICHLPRLILRCWLSLQGYGGDAVANRLRKTLLRIVNQSLTLYKAGVIASRPAHTPGSQHGTLCCSPSLHSSIHLFIHSFIHSFDQSVCVFLEGQVRAFLSSRFFAARRCVPAMPCRQLWLSQTRISMGKLLSLKPMAHVDINLS